MASQWHILAPIPPNPDPNRYQWYRTPSASVWRSTTDNDVHVHYWRLGIPSALDAARGRVVRGYRIRGELQYGTRNRVDLSALYNVLLPQPQWSIAATIAGDPEADYSFDIHRPDAGLPIGRFPTTGNWNEVASDEFAGIFSLNAVQSVGAGANPDDNFNARLRLQEFGVWLDDTPTWTLEAPSAVSLLEEEEVKVTLKWPSGEPIVGEGVTLVAGSVTRVRGDSQQLGTIARSDTDASGVARFKVRGEYQRSDQLKVHLTDTGRIHLYAPALDKNFDVVVVAGGETPPPDICVDYPEQLHVPGVEPHYIFEPVFGWDAGANSMQRIDGNVRLQFTMGRVISVVVGLAPAAEPEENLGRYQRIEHGFMFTQSTASKMMVQPIESGKLRGRQVEYSESTVFDIQRRDGSVLYVIDDEVHYRSRVASSGELMASTSLYASGDRAPGSGED